MGTYCAWLFGMSPQSLRANEEGKQRAADPLGCSAPSVLGLVGEVELKNGAGAYLARQEGDSRGKPPSL